MRKIACKLRRLGAEFQRGTPWNFLGNTISIPRKPEPSLSLARTCDSREYVEFLSAMFVVGVHRSERACWRRDGRIRARWGPTDRSIFERCARIRAHPGYYNDAFVGLLLTYVYLRRYQTTGCMWDDGRIGCCCGKHCRP